MLGPAVNRQPGFRRGLVEQSNAPKNSACCKLAAAATWLPTCPISWLAIGSLLSADLAAGSAHSLLDLCLFFCLARQAGSLPRWLDGAGWR